MTVADLLPSLPLPYSQASQYGLIFDAALAARLAEVQAMHPSRHYAKPVMLTNGRHLLCGDLLSEVGPGGLYAVGFSQLDAGRFSEIEVVPLAEALALLPPEPSPV
jgi:hypothetical protein